MSESLSVLVTGAAGFIGSHVAEHCLKLGFKVLATDDLSGGFLENVPAGCEFVQGDLRDPAFVASLWKGRNFDVVYHLGAYAAEGLSHFVRRFNYDTNLLASIHLLNECVNHGVKTYVFTSSIAVYGKGQTPMTEEMVPQPEDPYGISKYAIELDLKAAHEMFGLDYIVFRPHNVYGERQNIADKYRNVIGIFMNQVLQGQSMTVLEMARRHALFLTWTMWPRSLRGHLWFPKHGIRSSTSVRIHLTRLTNWPVRSPPRWGWNAKQSIWRPGMRSFTPSPIIQR